MLVRDPTCANSTGISLLFEQLKNQERQVAVFLVDHHPSITKYVTADIVIGIGWDDAEGMPPSLRWLGERLSPSSVNSCMLRGGEAELALRLGRAAGKLELVTATPAWIFAQPHIKTVADAAKLSRFMSPYTTKPLTI